MEYRLYDSKGEFMGQYRTYEMALEIAIAWPLKNFRIEPVKP